MERYIVPEIKKIRCNKTKLCNSLQSPIHLNPPKKLNIEYSSNDFLLCDVLDLA